MTLANQNGIQKLLQNLFLKLGRKLKHSCLLISSPWHLLHNCFCWELVYPLSEKWIWALSRTVKSLRVTLLANYQVSLPEFRGWGGMRHQGSETKDLFIHSKISDRIFMFPCPQSLMGAWNLWLGETKSFIMYTKQICFILCLEGRAYFYYTGQ